MATKDAADPHTPASLFDSGRRRGRSRLLAVLAGCFLAVLLAEGVSLLLFLSKDRTHRTLTWSESSPFQSSDDLGVELTPGARATVVAAYGEVEIFRATYSADEEGNRYTAPPAHPTTRTVHVFGGSFAFGEGLNDDETLAARLQVEAPGTRSVNRASPGYGPNHMLAMLQAEESRAPGAAGDSDVGVYVFIDGHVDRCVGSMFVVQRLGFCRRAPYYVVGEGGVERRGNFTDGRPLRSLAYRVLGMSPTLRMIGVPGPCRKGEAELELTAAVIEQAKAEFERTTASSRFAVAVYPGSKLGEEMSRHLAGRGVEVLDYSGLFDVKRPEFYLHNVDRHPSARAIEVLARALASDLKGN